MSAEEPPEVIAARLLAEGAALAGARVQAAREAVRSGDMSQLAELVAAEGDVIAVERAQANFAVLVP